MSAISTSTGLINCTIGQSRVEKGWVRRLNQWYINWRTRRQLARLPDFMLKDIGVARSEAEQEAKKPFWVR